MLQSLGRPDVSTYEHPSDAELQGFVRGELKPEAAKAVVAHLLGNCGHCLAKVEPEARCLVSEPTLEAVDSLPLLDPISESAYDLAIDRAVAGLLLHGEGVLQKKRQARCLQTLLAEGGVRLAREHSWWGATYASYEALLGHAWAIRFDKVGEMIELTRLACFVAPKLGREGYSATQVADFSARAWGEHGNALRIADRFAEAEECFDRAVGFWLDGTRDRFLQVRLMHFTASLLGDQRRLAEATQYITEVRDLYLELGDRHNAGKAMVNLCHYTGEGGDAEGAVRLAERALQLIDERREPEITANALYNKLHFLVEGGRFREARSWMWKHRRHMVAMGELGQINQVKLTYIDGRINAGLGDLDRAARQLRQAKADLEGKHVPLLEAIVVLDLASVSVLLGNLDEARDLALAAAERLIELNLPGEASRALPILRQAIDGQAITAALCQEVVQFLRREDHAPYLRYSHGRCSG
jgi:tetratricopeptide (TPR) repeat protein